MAETARSLIRRGVIRGNRIELADDPGLGEGREVEVVIRPVEAPAGWGAGIAATAGIMADDPTFEAEMEQIHRERKAAKFRDDPE